MTELICFLNSNFQRHDIQVYFFMIHTRYFCGIKFLQLYWVGFGVIELFLRHLKISHILIYQFISLMLFCKDNQVDAVDYGFENVYVLLSSSE